MQYLSRICGEACFGCMAHWVSMIYVPLDILSDTIFRSELRSDARMLAEEFGGATVMWGGVWLVLSLVAIVVGALTLRGGPRP